MIASTVSRIKSLTIFAVYAIGTFLVAALFASVLPSEYTIGVLAGWIIAMWLSGVVFRA